MTLSKCEINPAVTTSIAKWKQDAEYWFERDSVMFERLFNSVNEKLVCTPLDYLMGLAYVTLVKRYRSP